jgi:CDP-diacylglycerol--glycerol-3-phosphate 3-phosphatidyltransferase
VPAVLKERFGSAIDPFVLRIAPAVARIPLSANQLTVCGVLISLVAGLAFAAGEPRLGAALLLPAGFADLADGIVARARGTESRAGAFFDSSMDRVSDLLLYGGMAVGAAQHGDPRGAGLVMWALAAAVLTSYVRARAESELGEFSVGLMERAERFLVLIPLGLLDQLPLALWILALGGTFTAAQRIAVAYRRIADRERSGTAHETARPERDSARR